jgi:hypothetical protein
MRQKQILKPVRTTAACRNNMVKRLIPANTSFATQPAIKPVTQNYSAPSVLSGFGAATRH